jgi:prepilin-type N-terminal cleavage/methylation domain-containing protein
VSRQAGFTLLELIVVLVIAGVISAVTIPAFSSGQPDQPAAVGASELVALLRSARARALTRAQPVTLRIDARTRVFTVATETGDSIVPIAQGIVALPRGITLGAPASGAQFRFAPTGAARGDTLLVRGDGPAVAVWVDRWTGAPHVRH